MKINTIQKIEFFDREKEKEEIMNILRTEPQLINFILHEFERKFICSVNFL